MWLILLRSCLYIRDGPFCVNGVAVVVGFNRMRIRFLSVCDLFMDCMSCAEMRGAVLAARAVE